MAQIPNRIQFIRSKVHRGLFPAQASAKPNVLWIGCSSSGLQETQELGLSPGEILEHRNIGNMISNEDLSSASSVEYALKVEKVNDIVVCGHYGCNFANTDLTEASRVGPWLNGMRDLYESRKVELEKIESPRERNRSFAELHTWLQCRALLRTETVINAVRNRGVKVHAFMYDSEMKECVELSSLASE